MFRTATRAAGRSGDLIDPGQRPGFSFVRVGRVRAAGVIGGSAG